MKNINKLLLSCLLAVALITPSFTYAIDELGEDVDPQGSSSCLELQNNLRYRTTDAQVSGEVSALQDFLVSGGYLTATPNGYFGLQTFAAVKKFQSAHSISPTGYVGPLTRAQIKTTSCNGITNVSIKVPVFYPIDDKGCYSGAAYSNLTGKPCTENPKIPTDGCLTGAKFSSATGLPCAPSPTIVAPTIQILSPNNTENWVAGKSYDVKWTSAGVLKDTMFNIRLRDYYTKQEYNFPPYPASSYNDGIENVTVPNTVPGGTYILEMKGIVNGETKIFSNGYFMISPANDTGCSSGQVYSSTTGYPCSNTINTSATCPSTSFSRNLTVGDSGSDVAALQNFLKSKGYSSETASGYFGAVTKSALAAYQASKGISPADGYFGPIARAAMNADCAGNNTTPSITILSPNGGESYSVSSNQIHFPIRLKMPAGNNYVFSAYLIPSSDTPYNHTDEQGVRGYAIGGTSGGATGDINAPWSGFVGAPGKYKLRVYLGKYISGGSYPPITSAIAYDESDNYFTVTSGTTGSPITVTSPSGGESFVLGRDSLNIRWSPVLPGVSTIQLISSKGLKVGLYGQVVYGDPTNTNGYYVYKLPNDLSTVYPDTYYIKLTPADGSSEVLSNKFTILSPIVTVPPVSGKYSIAGITGQQSTYSPGAPITFSVKGIEADGTPASSQKGFNVQAHMYNQNVGTNPSIQAVNATYNASSGYWDVKLNAPSDASVPYGVEVSLYCGYVGLDSICEQKYGSNAQQNQTFQFKLTNSTAQPSIKIVSPNGGERYAPGQTVPILMNTNLTSQQAPSGINILLYGGGSSTNTGSYNFVQNIASRYLVGSSVYNWTIPTSLPAGNYTVYVVPDQLAYGVSNAGLFDFSDSYFTVAPVTATPSITEFKISHQLTTTIRSTTLVWNTTNASRCELSGPNFPTNSPQPTSAAISTGNLTSNSTYVLTCYNSAGNQVSRTLAVSVPTPIPSSITLLSPNGGESYKVGDTININWSNTGAAPTQVYMQLEDTRYVSTGDSPQHFSPIPFYSTPISNTGSYTWTIPSSIGNNLMILGGGNVYKLSVGDYSGSIADGSNNVFSIAPAASSAPSLTSISPTSATKGTMITLNGSGFKSIYTIINFRNGSFSQDVSPNSVSSDGTQIKVIVPYDFAPGTYTTTIVDLQSGSRISSPTSIDFTVTGVTATAPSFTVLSKSITTSGAPQTQNSTSSSMASYSVKIQAGSEDVTIYSNPFTVSVLKNGVDYPVTTYQSIDAVGAVTTGLPSGAFKVLAGSQATVNVQVQFLGRTSGGSPLPSGVYAVRLTNLNYTTGSANSASLTPQSDWTSSSVSLAQATPNVNTAAAEAAWQYFLNWFNSK